MHKKILIIEDEAAIQKILYEPLAFAGYEVTAASDGLKASTHFIGRILTLSYWISCCQRSTGTLYAK